MNLPDKCIVDTNVPKVANDALSVEDSIQSDFPNKCIEACVDAIKHVIKNNSLVMDRDGEIFNEYLRQLNHAKQLRQENKLGELPQGYKFILWILKDYWNSPDLVTITKNGETYDEFPSHEGLINFDKSDRKFVAAANAHQDKPPILQATDTKWWGWKDALEEAGISVIFLCPKYAEDKYEQKKGG